MGKCGWGLVLFAVVAGGALGAELRRETLGAFEQYVRSAEERTAARTSGRRGFLWIDESAERRERVRRGEAVTEPAALRGDIAVTGGLVHDWIGGVFLPGARLQSVLALVRDYNRHAEIYAPEVVASRVLWQDENRYRVYMRLLKKKVLTVVLNTEHEVEYFPLDMGRWHSRSYSVRVAEVENAGERGERELPEGQGHGFLWRLYSYWRFQERDGGVYVECQAISLTRDIPAGLGWLIMPIVRELPRESLVRTLEGTRRGVMR